MTDAHMQICVLTLAISLSMGKNIDSSSAVFSVCQAPLINNNHTHPPQLVFAVVSLGAVVLTLNVVLLGGNIGFFQSMCLLGYCIFPLAIASLVTNFVHNGVARWVVVGVCTAWSSWASVPFVGGSVSEKRRVLAIYPSCCYTLPLPGSRWCTNAALLTT